MNTGSGARYSACFLFRLVLSTTVLSTCLSPAMAAPVEIAAHRGGYRYFPENTCAAFRACDGIADRIEFDVRVAADGALVVLHDESVNRTATGFGPVTNVAELTLDQLKALDVGAKFSPSFVGERIPTLAEALRSLPPGIPALLHRKTGSATAILAVLRAENALSNLCVASGDLAFLFEVYQREPSLEFAYEGSGPISPHNIDVAKRLGVRTFLWDKTSVTTDLVARVHAADMRIAVAATRAECPSFIDMGVDRILADDPKLGKLLASDATSSNAQLAQNLAAYWTFDDALQEAAATNAADIEERCLLSFSGLDASSAWISGEGARLGGALALDGINDVLLGPPQPFLATSANQISISLWVKLSGLPSDCPANWSMIYDTPSNACAIYLDRAARELRFKVADANLQAARPGIPETNLVLGVWHHIVGVYDGSAGRGAGRAMIFLDGRLQDVHVGSDSSAGYGLTNVVRQGQTPVFGRHGESASSFFAGALDDAALWNRALSPAEIRQIHAAGTNGVPLERIVMAIWIANVYTDPETSDMVLDVRIDHGSLTNQTLNLRGTASATGSYSKRMALEGRRGNKVNFRVPRPDGPVHPFFGPGAEAAPRFFQISCP